VIKKTVYPIIVVIAMGILTLLLLLSRNSAPEPEPEPPATAPGIIVTSGTVKRGSTLEQILVNENIAYSEVLGIIGTFKSKHDVRRIRPGQRYELHRCTSKAVIEFRFWRDPVNYISVKRLEDGQFYSEKRQVPSEKILTTVHGEIETSLYEAMTERGVPVEAVRKFADIFAWQIDFLVEPRRGDRFELVYEQHNFVNNIIRVGKILVARYSGEKTLEHTGIYFEDSEQRGGYYDPEGNSLRKIFLRAPLNYSRISSHFTYRRFHPILRRWMPSLAIDYAAPTGTPVVSVGDGTVVYAGWGETRKRRGLGLHVLVRHNHIYTTWYSHLSRLPRGIKRGARVRQGQVIGYVGSTGLSTGPHLDFRVKKHGRFVNFLELELPPSESIPPEYRDEFKKLVEQRLQLLSSVETTSIP